MVQSIISFTEKIFQGKERGGLSFLNLLGGGKSARKKCMCNYRITRKPLKRHINNMPDWISTHKNLPYVRLLIPYFQSSAKGHCSSP